MSAFLRLPYASRSVLRRHLHSFPTRRSSDLAGPAGGGDGGGGGRRAAARGRAAARTAGRVRRVSRTGRWSPAGDRKSTRLNSSHTVISYAVFCVKKKKPGARNGASSDGFWSI